MAALENDLEPLPYQVEVREYLKSRERELWSWFASAQAKADYTETAFKGLSFAEKDQELGPQAFSKGPPMLTQLTQRISDATFVCRPAPVCRSVFTEKKRYKNQVRPTLNRKELTPQFGVSICALDKWM